MTDKLSEVARAIRKKCAEIEHRPEYAPEAMVPDMMWHSDEYAKAAIEAMEKALEAEGLVIVPRKPTEGMKVAGMDVSPMGRVKYDDGGALGKWVSYDTDKTGEIWTSMADFALEGK